MPDLTAKKIDDYSIEITKQDPQPEPKVNIYQRDFIEKQIKDIQAQKDAYDVQRDAELKECNDILVEMDKLGITKEVA